jgi:hypothetical protein
MRSASEKAAAVSGLSNNVKQMEQRACAKKDFESKQSSVFTAPGLPLAHFLTAESGCNSDGREVLRKQVSNWSRRCSVDLSGCYAPLRGTYDSAEKSIANGSCRLAFEQTLEAFSNHVFSRVSFLFLVVGRRILFRCRGFSAAKKAVL